MAKMAAWLENTISLLNGFRKFVIMFSLIVIGIAFRLSGHISGQEFVDLLQNTAVAYMTFNGVEHLTNAVKEWIKDKTSGKTDSGK